MNNNSIAPYRSNYYDNHELQLAQKRIAHKYSVGRWMLRIIRLVYFARKQKKNIVNNSMVHYCCKEHPEQLVNVDPAYFNHHWVMSKPTTFCGVGQHWIYFDETVKLDLTTQKMINDFLENI